MGLKQGGTYYYYFVINNSSNFYDVNTPFTSLCPLLPGQPVNILEVPIERPASSGSSVLLLEAERKRDGVRKAEVLLAQARQKMMSPLLRRKRTGSGGTTMAKERKEKMRSEWVTKGMGKLQDAPSRMEEMRGDGSVVGRIIKDDKALRKACSAPDVLPTGTLLATTTPKGQNAEEVEQARSVRESFGTMSLASESALAAEAERLRTPRREAGAADSQLPSLYHSATSSVETTPKSLLETPHAGNAEPKQVVIRTAIHEAGKLELSNMLPNYAQADYEAKPTALGQSWSMHPEAYSRHTLGNPSLPSIPLRQAGLPAYANTTASPYDESTSTLHPFFTQGNRHSVNGASSAHPPAVLSRADTERGDDHTDDVALDLGLMRQKMDVFPVNVSEMGAKGTGCGLGLGLGIDLDAVNAKLLGQNDSGELDAREFAYLRDVIY